MNNSEIIKQSALDAAMCAVPAIMPMFLRRTTVELESDMFGLVTLYVRYCRVAADLESGAEETIEVHAVFLSELNVTNMLTNDTMDVLINEILG